MTFNEIRTALYDFAVASTSKTWVHNLQNAKRPAYPYGLISFVSLTPRGQQEFVQGAVLPDDVEEKMKNYYEMSFTFSYLGDDAQQTILDLMNNSKFESIRKALYSKGIGHQGFGMSRDLSMAENDKVTARYDVDLIFNLVIEADQVTPFIKSVEFSGEFDYPSKV